MGTVTTIETKRGTVSVERWGLRWNVRFTDGSGTVPFPSRKKAMEFLSSPLSWVNR